MDTIHKYVKIVIDEEVGNVYVTIKYDDGKLSICGVEGPFSNGNAKGGCGQIYGKEYSEPLIDLKKFFDVWERWHLNDMQAGSYTQEMVLRNAREKGWKYDYKEACEKLKELDLYIDDGYSYGSAWMSEAVPDDVIEYLKSLPENDSMPTTWKD